MSAAALAASLLCLLGPAAGETAQLYLATERPFAPDTPGAVVKLEVPGARSVDVRLYRLDDPERFLAAQRAFEAAVEAADGLDLSRVRVSSPAIPLLRLQLGIWFLSTNAHTLRHLGQARRVLSDPRFPD